MASWFRVSRNIELSLLYYIETSLNADWTGITVVKTFKKAYHKDTALPIVCIRLSDTSATRQEVGSDTLDSRYLLILDIFSTSDGQRLDLADYIKDKLKNGWIHYDHSHASGDNTTLTRIANGRDMVTEFTSDTKIEFGENVDERDQYRHTISVRARHTNS